MVKAGETGTQRYLDKIIIRNPKMVALFFLIVRNFASRSLQLFDIGDWTKKYLSIMDIYDKAIQELLEKYRSISSVKKESIERAIHCLLEQKEIAKSLSDSGISFCYQ